MINFTYFKNALGKSGKSRVYRWKTSEYKWDRVSAWLQLDINSYFILNKSVILFKIILFEWFKRKLFFFVYFDFFKNKYFKNKETRDKDYFIFHINSFKKLFFSVNYSFKILVHNGINFKLIDDTKYI